MARTQSGAASVRRDNATTTINKGTNTLRKIQIRTLFRAGGKYTAVQLNQIIGFNDARKVISDLRRDGMYIKDVRLEDRRKLYWLADDGQLSLFNQEGGRL